MGLLKLVMKYGIGSPGSIAKAMARTHQAIKRRGSSDDRDILRQLYLSRVAAASRLGRSAKWGYSAEPAHVEKVVAQNPDLQSLVMYVIVCEHPEVLTAALPNSWEALEQVVEEVLDRHAPGWRR